ncbi:uncharacterized protein LOC104583720 isoform X2 [Brachypodium distachyon]|uniref:uncharacterized protein LOC104583720 isoform X2 n=1 Tax=Brachypodium distachyon TaxID=15368 RepID=UPI000D0D1DC7|nr:uncharacterized protein LOC104583720 isoform X2 [Brachypodium distachyon]|eukprot:XP_024316384.1 uncharacterized protein LOC104583720 isoform X2 [Brachypodium distachyon]
MSIFRLLGWFVYVLHLHCHDVPAELNCIDLELRRTGGVPFSLVWSTSARLKYLSCIWSARWYKDCHTYAKQGEHPRYIQQWEERTDEVEKRKGRSKERATCFTLAPMSITPSVITISTTRVRSLIL